MSLAQIKLLHTDLNLYTCRTGILKKKKKTIYIVIGYCSKPHTGIFLQHICIRPLTHTHMHMHAKIQTKTETRVPTGSGSSHSYKIVGGTFSTSRSFGNGDAVGEHKLGELKQVQSSCGGFRVPQAAFRVCDPAVPPLPSFPPEAAA